MDNNKGEQNRKYDFIFEGEKTEDFPKEVAPDLNDVMDAPAKEPAKNEPVKDVVHEEKFRFDGKVEDNELSDMKLEDLGHDFKEEEPPKPVLNDELKEIAEKTPEEPAKKEAIMSEPTPEELEAKSLEEKLEMAAKEVGGDMRGGASGKIPTNTEERNEMRDMKKKAAKNGGCRGNWVYLLIAGLMGMAIGACVIVALVYGGVIGGKVKTEFRDKIIVQECECEECKCECEEEEEDKKKEEEDCIDNCVKNGDEVNCSCEKKEKTENKTKTE